MNIDTNSLLSVTDANHNFSKVTKAVEQYGVALLLKNNAPKYVVLDISDVDEKDLETLVGRIRTSRKRKAK